MVISPLFSECLGSGATFFCLYFLLPLLEFFKDENIMTPFSSIQLYILKLPVLYSRAGQGDLFFFPFSCTEKYKRTIGPQLTLNRLSDDLESHADQSGQQVSPAVKGTTHPLGQLPLFSDYQLASGEL